jgi:uncharacterized protein (DUF2141 family)
MKGFPPGDGVVGIALALAMAAAPAPLDADSDPVGSLAVKVVGLRNDNGRVCAYVFDTADAWPGEWKRATRRACTGIEGGAATFAFERLPYGRYAVSVVHDEDGDYGLTTNLIGMPKEGVGASNNPTSRFGPPSFEAARFELASARESIRIRIKYLL